MPRSHVGLPNRDAIVPRTQLARDRTIVALPRSDSCNRSGTATLSLACDRAAIARIGTEVTTVASAGGVGEDTAVTFTFKLLGLPTTPIRKLIGILGPHTTAARDPPFRRHSPTRSALSNGITHFPTPCEVLVRGVMPRYSRPCGLRMIPRGVKSVIYGFSHCRYSTYLSRKELASHSIAYTTGERRAIAG